MAVELAETVFENLRLERLNVQKKTFTKWANVHLIKYGLHIDDLFQDLGDGLKLMKLLESLTGEKLGKPAKGSARINKIENVSRCLAFLHSKKMRLENISSEDIVDGKPHLILGLLWTIILRCEIWQNQQPTVLDTGNDIQIVAPPPPDHRIAKDSLLLWCQNKTNGYPNVHVRDFHRSWRDGLAFNALIHSHDKQLVDFQALKQNEHIRNLEHAFDVAQKFIGVPRLLDPEDVDTDNPDEKSIIIYVSSFSKRLANITTSTTAGKRIANVLQKKLELDKLKQDYHKDATELLNWIDLKVYEFESRPDLDSLESIQQEIQTFKEYRTKEKPVKNDAKNEIEALLFSIQMKRLDQRVWAPPEGTSPAEIEKSWNELERAEHQNEINVREQLKHQEKMENLAYKFESKRSVREGYLKEMKKILTDPNYGSNIKQADATFKKHEAIRTGIVAREIMIMDLLKTADALVEGNYRNKEDIIKEKTEIEEQWKYVLNLLDAFDEKFANLRQIMSILDEMDSITEEMNQMKIDIETESEPFDVESSLQNHAVREVQVASWGEAVRRLEIKVIRQEKTKDATVLQNQLTKLRQSHQSLEEVSNAKREYLENLLKRKQQLNQVEELLSWIQEKHDYCVAEVNCKDLPSALLLQKEHKSLGRDIQLQKKISKDMQDDRINELFHKLDEAYPIKSNRIDLSVQFFEYSAEADECESWISDKLHLLSKLDYGSDELSCDALARRQVHMHTNVLSHQMDIERLRQDAERICNLKSHQENVTPLKLCIMPEKSNEYSAPVTERPEHQNLIKTLRDRQDKIETSFAELQKKCEERQMCLRHNSLYFRLKDGCDEMEKWMRQKEHFMDTSNFGEEEEENVEKSFEAFLNDLAGHGLIIDELRSISEILNEEHAEQANTARMIFDNVDRRWKHLHVLTTMKEKNWKGFTSLMLAHRTCDETIAFLDEKSKIQESRILGEIRNIDALRRRQQALQRELEPAEERVKQALVLAENVSNSHPDQKDQIQKKIKDLNEKWTAYQKLIEERKRKLEETAGLQIFHTSSNELIDWANMMVTKLSVREKIGDIGVVDNLIKEHGDLRDETASQDERFQDVEQLGVIVLKEDQTVEPLLSQLEEAKKMVLEHWEEKEIWLQQKRDLQLFNKEADQLLSLCSTQGTLLESTDQGDNLSDVENLLRNHDALVETMKAQEPRYQNFQNMVEALISAGHSESEFVQAKSNQVQEQRDKVKNLAERRKQLLLDVLEFQEFKTDAQELGSWIDEKNKLATDLSHQDITTNLPYKMKRQQTFEAEVGANRKRLKQALSRGEDLLENNKSIDQNEVTAILEDLGKAWNMLIDMMEINQNSLNQALSLRDFSNSVEHVIKKLNEITHAASSSNIGKDLRSVKTLIKSLETLENDKKLMSSKIMLLVQEGEQLIEDNCSEDIVRKLINNMNEKLNESDKPLSERRRKLEICLKFYQYISDVDREILWISEQMQLISTTPVCRTLLDAQKFMKKIETLEVAIENHKIVIESLQEKVLLLVTEDECPVDVTQPSILMKEQWTQLLKEFGVQKEKALISLKAQSFYCEAGEIDIWTTEKLEILTNNDYGKDEDAVIKLLTKHKAIELEIDSYKGLVDELGNQADTLIDSNHPDAKVIKNRMEVINQEMKNLQKLCTSKREKLLESKSKYEFENETEELKEWISDQMVLATSEDYGEDYEHVLVLHQNFEFFKTRIESGSKRVIQYEEFAKRLINSNCYFAEDVKKNLEYLSGRWSELVEAIEARTFKLEAAAEIHRYHRDVTDILSRIHSHYRVIPQDLGNNLNQAQDLIKKHDKIENELLGIEAQVHILLSDSQRLQEVYPGGNEEHIQMQLALVVENWNLLQQKVSTRKDLLLIAQQIHKFLASARDEEAWSKSICLELNSGLTHRDIQQMENEHKLLGTEIEARLENYEELKEEGLALQTSDIFQSQVEEKLKSLSEICTRVREAYNRRSNLVQQKKEITSFFNEAKQIQLAFAQREVQLCGSETRETVEDISNALKKHQEFQKSMDVQEEKFMNWKNQGNAILKQGTDDATKIEKKIEELSERRQRLLDFSSERCQTLSEALKLAKFKRDTIEAEAWIQEKRNKLRLVLKDYSKMDDVEKIKCLQKQQAVQAELDAHESFINHIIQQSRELTTGEEAKTRLQLILDDWNEVKENAAQIGNDLLQARDMLQVHNSFEKAEAWIKEKELMIQVGDVGKDYEHCMALQSKLDDSNSDKKIDESSLKSMRDLAMKLSRNDDYKGVYSRYETIYERWIQLKEEMMLYQRKLKDAAQVHSFMKDVDDTIERIREKTFVLSAREEVEELNKVQEMQRKIEKIELDLTVLQNKVKEQEQMARNLAERHELSAGKISDKMNHVQKEWHSLQEELKDKKSYINSAFTSLKYIKDVNDSLRIINETVAELEFGELPSNSSDAQGLLRSHSDIQPQISMKQEETKMLQEKGNQLLRQPGLSHKEIEYCIQSLQETSNNLDTAWQNRHKALLQCRDLQLFLEKTKQIENWLSAKEAFLKNQDIGDSMSSVEALIRKHENFEETIYANFEKIREIEMMARDLKDHDDYELIQSHCEEIFRRRDNLQDSCARRKNILQDSKTLQQLLLDMYEISHWMNEKIRVASDESYKDLTNLLSKTQKHMAFEAEIMANHSRVVDFTQEAEKLLQENHFSSSQITQHVEMVQTQWEELMNATNFKKERLLEASDALQFTRKLEDIRFWLEEAETHIEFTDYDMNFDSLEHELDKNQELQNEAEENADTLRLLKDVSEEFQQANHFSKDKIISEFKDTVQRFHSVENGLIEKRNQLEESLLLSELDKDINEELSWIEENIKVCESEDYYDDIMTVQALQKKLQALETEIVSREPLISSVVERGRRAKREVGEENAEGLEARFQVLKDSASLKRLRLADALEAQKYYFEANQAEMWIKEKLSQVIGYSFQRDVYSVQAIQKKMSTIDAASAAFRTTIQTLEEISSSLVARNHFESHNIQLKQEEVTDQFEELRKNILKKTALLKEKEDYFLYEKDVKNLISQLKSLSNIATSGDLAKDVEHVESLLQKFEVFGNKLRNCENLVKTLQEKGNHLIEQGHSEIESIFEILKELDSTWEKCKESADNRQKVLEREKLLHTFYKSLDETESWITEKDVALSSQDYGHDLESIKTLLKHHDTLEGDLKAIDEQVQALEEEAVLLKEQFPDSKEEIEIKHQTVQVSWIKCQEKSANRKDKLQQAEQLQSYFDEARDFHAWIYEMSALITSNDIPQDVSAVEALLAQHEGYKSEIDAQMRSFYLFENRGKEIIESGHFLSQDIETKVDNLGSSFKELLATWEKRRLLYEQTLDLQLFKKTLVELETWLSAQEYKLNEENGRSVEEVDYLIQKHEQFEKKLELYEIKFQELLEATKAEKSASQKIEEEEKKRVEEEKKLEQQRLEEIRRKEEERLLEERRKERQPSESQKVDYDDDYLRFESLTPDEPTTFTRMTSIRRSNKEIADSGKILSPVIQPATPPVQRDIPRELPPTTAEGFLMRKQEFQSGGKRATSRQWKNYYTVLCGQLLCFFKDKKAFRQSNAAKPPVNILNAQCYIPVDYHKKKYVFRLELSDRSVFLFEALNDIKRQEWMKKVNYTAKLPPNKQLMTVLDENNSSPTAKRLDLAIPEEDRRLSDVEPNQYYANGDQSQSYLTPDDFRLRTLSEESQNANAFEDPRLRSSDEESWYKETVSENQRKSTIVSDDSSRRASSDDIIQPDEPYYSNVFARKSVQDSFYDDPFEEARRSFSATSYDVDPQSARSSLSNTSSYRTAAEASNSSLSTLQDERTHEWISSDEDNMHSMPHTTPRGSTTSRDTAAQDDFTKRQSWTPSTMDPNIFEKVKTKPKQRRRWFSLRS